MGAWKKVRRCPRTRQTRGDGASNARRCSSRHRGENPPRPWISSQLGETAPASDSSEAEQRTVLKQGPGASVLLPPDLPQAPVIVKNEAKSASGRLGANKTPVSLAGRGARGSPFTGPKEWARRRPPSSPQPTAGRERWKDGRTRDRDEGRVWMRRDALEDAVTFRMVFHLVSQVRQGQAARGLPEDCHHVCKRERAVTHERRAQVLGFVPPSVGR